MLSGQAPCRCLKPPEHEGSLGPWIQYQDMLLASAYNVDRATGVCREPIAMGRAPNVIRTGSLQVRKDRHGHLSMKGVWGLGRTGSLQVPTMWTGPQVYTGSL